MNKNEVVSIGTQKYTRIIAGYGHDFGAHHVYLVESVPPKADDPIATFASVTFQKGPVKENGVNGCHNEDLIAIVIHRLQHLNQGYFRCRENSTAITKLEESLMWLRKRTEDRVARGVEGTALFKTPGGPGNPTNFYFDYTRGRYNNKRSEMKTRIMQWI